MRKFHLCQGQGEETKDDAPYFESLSMFVSKVRGETFTWEQARDMTFKDIAKNVEVGLLFSSCNGCMRMWLHVFSQRLCSLISQDSNLKVKGSS